MVTSTRTTSRSKRRAKPAAAPTDQPAAGSETSPAHGFPVVGIGASAGGLEAFTALLQALPADTGMAFVLIQHMDPTHESFLTSLLARSSKMPVREVTDGLPVEPDHVYVIPPNTNMTIREGVLRLVRRREAGGRHLPIDHFLCSLAEDRKSSAVGVILSGIASDGTRGLEAIKAEGGITIAQDELSARHPGMPISAVAAGCVDFVESPSKIAAELARLGRHPYLTAPRPPEPRARSGKGGDGYRRICLLLRDSTGVDFEQYKPATINRRIARRMLLHKTHSLDKYFQFLAQHPAETEALFQDILIHVTGFFRDPDVWKALRAKVLRKFIARHPGKGTIRVWVPGCSTGEEAYTIAMLLLEGLGDRAAEAGIQIFGTDISEPAIEQARSGVYREAAVSGLSPQRLRRFFTKVEGGYQIDRSVREKCVFARQNLAQDPPFSKLDLISCRNVLIYLLPVVQARILATFHYALLPEGRLFLGISESLAAHPQLFSAEDRANRIFSRQPGSSQQVQMAVASCQESRRAPAGAAMHGAGFDLRKEAERLLLERYAPAALVVDPELHILHFQGNTRAYLAPAAGEPSFHLLRMLRPELIMDVRAAIQKVKKHGIAAKTPPIRLKQHGGWTPVQVEVAQLKGRQAKGCDFIVLFRETGQASEAEIHGKTSTPKGAEARPAKEAARLQRELAAGREHLRSLIEDHEAASEELRAANEEVLSSNEELQSTNEELETAKEELQTTNEELTTLNEELQHRNAELGHLTTDLSNLLTGVNIPVVILDSQLRISRFTPVAAKLLNLIPTDVGRPFGNITPNLVVPDWGQLFSEVLNQSDLLEREVQDRDGHWYSLRIRPYKTGDDKVAGLLIALLDIDAVKRSLEETRRLNAELERRVASRTAELAEVNATLVRRNQELETASRAKSDFLARMSHELRTPLNAVIGFSGLLAEQAEGTLGEQQLHFVSLIREGADHLLQVISDILDVSRIEAGRLELSRELFPAADAVAEVLRGLRPAVSVDDIQIESDVSADLLLYADRTRFKQILYNLLSNALKFTPAGGRIWIEAARQDGRIWLSVCDTGMGIAAEDQEDIFREFHQAGTSTKGVKEGTGLGLTITRLLVERHGGEIWVVSQPGKGSRFTLTLPEAQPGSESPSVRPRTEI